MMACWDPSEDADDDEVDTIVDIAPPVPSSQGGHVLPRSTDVEWEAEQ